MKKGQTSYDKDDVQNSLFPLDRMEITQGSGTQGGDFSHTGSKAVDYVGTSGRYPYYAPFDCELVYKSSDGAGVGWKSDGKVNTPQGRQQITVVFYHDNDASGMSIGTTKKQGEQIGKTGTAGRVTGDHVHIEIFKGQAYNSADIENWEAFFIDDTEIVDDFDYDWVKTDDDSGGGGGVEMPDPVIKNEYLSREDMKPNAQYIAYYLTGEGWTPEAIAGLLGNMEEESTINPGLWEGTVSYEDDPYQTVEAHGYGLVQWTPFNKFTKWARDRGDEYEDIEVQLERLLWEVDKNEQWLNARDPKGRSFKEFTQSTDSARSLAMAFIDAYERPKNPNQPIRGDNAEYWLDELEFKEPGDAPDPEEPGGGGQKEKNHKYIEMLLSGAVNGWYNF